MSTINRREFLDRTKKTSLAMAAGVTILRSAESARAYAANDKITLASIGVKGRGRQLAQGFLERGDCQVAYICDPDSTLFASRSKAFAEQQGGKTPTCVQDMRKALDDASVDAVVVATPDHWHALAAIWAVQAGKDVYVEKPPSANCWEGRQMVKAARKYDRIMQVGTQNRSAPYNIAARKYIEEGKLGDIHMCRVYNQKLIRYPDAVPDSDPPEGFDWDLFNGPAPEARYNANYRHWHAWWRYSSGDMANDGVHQLDIARWLCGVEYPQSVYCTGGRFRAEGCDESPDSQVAVFEFPKLVMTFELTLYTPYMLKSDGVLRESDILPYWPQNATRIEIYGTEGLMCVGRHGGGWQVFDRPRNRQPVVKDSMYGRFPDPEHKENFLQCVRSRALPNADIEKGHRSALLVHYATASYRAGGVKVEIDPDSEQMLGDEKARALFKREYRRPWVVPDEV
ncbi:MAG: Gfo/Idh/MocA family oxidoreductase [Pirellulales bacterium]|nr:Gfo/Idh/MocA family oxidoreductase [Pirellulales bacterium]